MSLGHQLVQNVLTSWLGYALRILIGFFFVPYITATLGSERYGIWVIAFQIVGYFTLFDLGLERAVVKFVAHLAAREDFGAVTRIFSTAASLYFALGACALITSWLFGFLVFDIFKAPLAVIQEGRGAFYLLGLLLALRLCLSPWTSTVVGLQRSDVINALDIGEEVLRVALLVIVLSLGGNLTWLAAAVLGAGMLRLVGTALWLRIRHSEIGFMRSGINQATRRDLFRYAGISLAINLAWLVVFGTDMALLGLLSSSSAAGLYAPAANIMLYLRNAVNAAGTPLAPAVASLESRNLGDSVQDAYLRGIKYVSFGSVFLASGVVLYAVPFVRLWLPPEFGDTAGVMAILAIGSAVFLPQIIGNAVLFGLEKHKYLLAALACEAALKLALSLALIGSYGAAGMAAATAAAQVVTCLSVYPYVMSRVLNVSLRRLLLTQTRSGLLAVLATIPVAVAASHLMPPDSWPVLVTNILIVTIVSAIVGFGIILESSDRSRILEVLLRRNGRSESSK
jgi:O-antigen/teichoic acid export membrane protein